MYWTGDPHTTVIWVTLAIPIAASGPVTIAMVTMNMRSCCNMRGWTNLNGSCVMVSHMQMRLANEVGGKTY